MKNSHIEWTDHTFNPWEGCTKVSPGCAHCYAEARNQRFAAGANWGPGAPRRRTSAANWRQPLAWNRRIEDGAKLRGYKVRERVFCASLADWLDAEVPIEWLADLLDLIRRTPNLDRLLLTKRPQNWMTRIKQVYSDTEADDPVSDFALAWFQYSQAPRNVWIGTTVEDQTRANERIPLLRQIPARVRFLSCEPLLGPVKLYNEATIGPEANNADVRDYGERWLDWVICGGESGHGARPMHPDWARSLRDQCAESGVPFFFKQWGAHAWTEKVEGDPSTLTAYRAGKLAAGRLLDGKEHNARPSPA